MLLAPPSNRHQGAIMIVAPDMSIRPRQQSSDETEAVSVAAATAVAAVVKTSVEAVALV